jgi:hypothetical protein
MLSTRRRVLLALALALFVAPAALAQKPEEQNAQKPEDNYVTSRMFQSRVFDIKNRDPINLSRVLGPLTSGFKGAVVMPNPDFRTITVRDFPENIAVISEAISRLDRPEPARPAVEFHVHMLVASNDDAAGSRYPAELGEVVKQLQSTLGFKNFTLMGSQIVRGKEGRGEDFNEGVAALRLAGDDPAGKNLVHYSYIIGAVALDSAGGQPVVRVEEFRMDMKVPVYRGGNQISTESVGFKNPVSMREGESVVAGTMSMADKSVVVVISASTVK